MTITISDYDGIISLANIETYRSFVDEKWELEQLKKHFVNEMNRNAIIVWQTNALGGGNWKIKITTTETNDTEHPVFIKNIEVTNGRLYLADYTDLTMAAQFEDHIIPAKGHENQVFEIENGLYQAKIKRFFNPMEEINEDEVAFKIVLKKISRNEELPVTEVFWWTF